MRKKRPISIKQSRALAKGREKRFQNQLKQRGIPKIVTQTREIIVPKIIKQPVPSKNMGLQISLFKKFLNFDVFPIKIGGKTKNSNLINLIPYLISRLNECRKRISEVSGYVLRKDKIYEKKFAELEDRISELENRK